MSQSPLDQRVRHIVRHAYDRTPVMNQRMRAAGLTPDDVQSADDLARLPVIKKDDMVRLQAENPPFGGLLAVELTDLKWIYFSPGPLYEGVMDDEGIVADSTRLLRDIGFTEQDIVLITMSYHLVPFGTRFDGAVRKLGATAVPAGVGNTELQVKMLLDLGVTAYIGTPSFLMTLIQKVEEMGLKFNEVSRLNKAIVTAEPLPPSLRQQLKSYGLRLHNNYGTAEAGLLGYECEQESGFHVPDNVLVQICDPQSGALMPHGEMGEVVATTFNEAYPIIRLGTGDLSIMNPEPCACGRPSWRIMGWMGRSGEAIKVRGMFLHPNQLKMVMARFESISRYQAVVTRSENHDVLTIRVELADQNANQPQLAEALSGLIKDVCRVRADGVEFVAPGSIPDDARPVVDERTWQ